MIHKNPAQVSDRDLERLLDAALTKYASVEPRAGLEDRVLANLQVEPTRIAAGTWWRWGLAALAAMVVLAIALALRPGVSKPVVVQQVPATRQATPPPEAPITRRVAAIPSQSRAHPRTNARRSVARTSPLPKLDQFPSPQPLTAEEKMLMGYVDQNPEKAALLAEARMESLRHDEEERHKLETEDQRTMQ